MSMNMDEFKIPDSSSIIKTRISKDQELAENLSTSVDTVDKSKLVVESKKSALANTNDDSVEQKNDKPQQPPQQVIVKQEKKSTPEAIFAALTYEEPHNRAPADTRYKLEVLKNGSIVEMINFHERSSYVIGRIPGCDIAAEHPTISRIHAILQFVGEQHSNTKDIADDASDSVENLKKGLYIYDLNSTHGTFLNKNRVYPNKYYRLHVGHVLKFGNSTRLYIVVGPSDDEEEESSKTVTELLQERLNKEMERKKLEAELKLNDSAKQGIQEESDGIDWGMGEDADEESDLRENPFAMDFDSSELNLDNPKKTLRGWFDREGCELNYDVREKANGQFICTINLPIDGPNNRPIFAEVDVKGKKKDAVAQCALQACQILDKYGLLRQSHRENRSKRKAKNVDDEDFYSSDEDTFLDRTGSAEKKREKRMKLAGKVKEKTENYESLTAQNDELQKQIDKLNSKIISAEKMSREAESLDPLDAYMMDLKTGVSDIKKLKSQLKELMTEQSKITKLMAFAKPTFIPINLSLNVKEKSQDTALDVNAKSPDPESDRVTVTASASTAETKTTDDKVTELTEERLEKRPSVPNVNRLYGPKPQLKSLNKKLGPTLPTETEVQVTSTSIDVEDSDQEDNDDESENAVANKGTPIEDVDEGENAVENVDEGENAIADVDEGEDAVEDAEEDAKVDSSHSSKKKRHRKYKKEKKNDIYDVNDPDYSVWLPPTGQSGDGRTSLNEKLGY